MTVWVYPRTDNSEKDIYTFDPLDPKSNLKFSCVYEQECWVCLKYGILVEIKISIAGRNLPLHSIILKVLPLQ